MAAIGKIPRLRRDRPRWRSRPGSMPAGSRAGLAASLATSLMVRVALVAAAENTPSANLTTLASTARVEGRDLPRLLDHFGARRGDPPNRRASPSASRRCPRRRRPGRCRPGGIGCRPGSRPRRSQTICLNTVSWPLPLVDRPVNKVAVPPAVEPDLGALVARRTGALDRVGDAEPAQLAALLRRLAPRRKSIGIGEAQRHLHVFCEFAAVIGEAQAGLERHRCGGNWCCRRRSSAGVDAQG